MTRRWFFVPSGDGHGWDLVEATKAETGWTVRRPGRFGAQQVPKVPPPDADWVEAEAPGRKPRVGVRTKEPAGNADAQARKAAEAVAAARAVDPPPRPARKPAARHTKAVPRLSGELLDLLAKEQRDAPAPAGMVKCPLCGVAVAPMKARNVRTHDDPVKGGRCAASGQRLSA
jgi:hypothetical protein